MKLKNSEFYNYDSRRKVLLCRGRIELINTLKLIAPKLLNVKKTLKYIRAAGYVDLEGNAHNFRNYAQFFTHLEKEAGLPIIGNRCVIVGLAKPLFNLQLKDIPETLLEETVPKTVEVKEEVAPVVETAPATLDIEYAKSLLDENDKKESKNKLADYAESFGIQLQKNKKFEDMLNDLVAAI